MIGILCAMDIEIEKLLKMVENAETRELAGYRYCSGKLGGKDVVLAQCGIGKVNAAVCTQTMILTYHPDLIINSGVAGSLSPELSICDVAVSTDVVQHDVDTSAIGDPLGMVSTVNTIYFTCDPDVADLVCAVGKDTGVHTVKARIASGDQFITEKTRKQWIVEHFNAMACDMEGGAIAQVCRIAGVRCAIIRAISDSTDEQHGMEFAQFAPIAADNSVKVVMETLKRL